MHCLAQENSISLKVNGLKDTGGKLRIGIFNNPEDFKNKEYPVYKKSLLFQDTVVEVSFQKIVEGRYAIAVYHDENNDYRLNTKKLGVPSEGVGFSGALKNKLKPPDFEAASFHLLGDTIILIQMRYPK